jgi:predicted O-linked N-acetylglucosamine transferase (SPINDLY family)
MFCDLAGIETGDVDPTARASRMARSAGRNNRRAGGSASAKASAANQLQAGLQRHMAGDLAGAVGIYNGILTAEPRNADALHLLGVACLQSGRFADAVDLIGRAIAVNDANPDYHGNLAATLLRLERDDEAATAARAAIARNPRNAGFHSNLAVALKRLGRHLEAADAFSRALSLNPTVVHLHKEIGDLHMQAKSFEPAIEHYQAYMAQAADDPELHVVWNNLACAFEKRGRLAEADELYRKALAVLPDDPDYLNNVGLVCRMIGRFDDAETYLRRAVEIAPDDHKCIANLSGLLVEYGRLDEAEEILKEPARRNPDNARLWTAFGNVYKTAGKPEAARDAYARAVKLEPDNIDAYLELSTSYSNAQDYQSAYDTLKKVLEIDPMHVTTQLLLCETLSNLKRPDEANIRAHAVTLLPDYLPQNLGYPMKAFRFTCDFDGIDELGDILGTIEQIPAPMLPMALLHLQVLADTPERTVRLVEQHRRWGDWLIRKAQRNPLPPLPARQPGGKIRIGFLSSDLNAHSVAKCLMPFLEEHDRDRFEIYCYSPKEVPNDYWQTAIQKAVHKFRFMVGRPDIEFAEAIRDDAIDILFDLNGVTQASRTPVMAFRAAPVQISYLGYPFTYGVSTIDYMLLDRYLKPESEDLLVEKPLIMPGSWICFNDMGKCDVNPTPPSDEKGYVTFGTLNNPYKFTREAVAAWAAVMREVPNSRFLMVRWYDGSTLRCHHLATEFARHGIEGDRVLFLQNEPGKHLPCYHQIDLSLDTFPLTGGTTTCDALWMGVPVVSLRGASYHQRISHAILNHAGLGDLSCGTQEEFVRTAVALANDVERRRELRGTLRGRLLESDMFRADRFVPDFQDTMMSLVEKHGLR